MSDTPNGPGWWQASDGRWYPPESHPSNQPPLRPPSPPGTPVTGQPGYPGLPASGGQPGYGAPYVPAPAAKSGMPGWLKALLIIGLVLVVAVGGCTVLVGTVLSRNVKDLTSGCDFLSNQTATASLGSGETLVPLRGLAKLASVALDNRVLPSAPSCMLSATKRNGYTGRVARLQSSDASKVFATEVQKSHGTKVDKGGGLTVESEGYYDAEANLGDEAFCTTPGLPPSTGVLVRKGDTLVYVSLSPTQAQLDDLSSGNGSALEGTTCQTAQKLARAVLGI